MSAPAKNSPHTQVVFCKISVEEFPIRVCYRYFQAAIILIFDVHNLAKVVV